MKYVALLLATLTSAITCIAQSGQPTEHQRRDITALIGQYSLAREKSDTLLLKEILTNDIDQLVSSGEWRTGLRAAVNGMRASSASSPGTRTLTVDRIRMLDPATAIVDCRYEIQNPDGITRKMWSTFVVLAVKKDWKISAIRNMLPASSR
ncbi:MAG: DUF4440 domain-containing protein [Bacteroidota bacterium]|nr:DUF4440 domain-containing protein [Bacteroidota bacterium]